MGIAALISTVVGALSGLLPDVVTIWKDGAEAKRERDMLELQHKMQLALAEKEMSAKLDETASEAMLEEIRAARAAMTAAITHQSTPIGIAWIDGFNAMLRPASAAMIIALFIFVALGFSSVISAAAFEPLFLLAIEAVLGFLFGYRSARKEPILGGWRTT
ncbi:MAG: hypothetical protein AAGF32_09145 [Pseudomonadota bacterium]